MSAYNKYYKIFVLSCPDKEYEKFLLRYLKAEYNFRIIRLEELIRILAISYFKIRRYSRYCEVKNIKIINSIYRLLKEQIKSDYWSRYINRIIKKLPLNSIVIIPDLCFLSELAYFQEHYFTYAIKIDCPERLKRRKINDEEIQSELERVYAGWNKIIKLPNINVEQNKQNLKGIFNEIMEELLVERYISPENIKTRSQ